MKWTRLCSVVGLIVAVTAFFPVQAQTAVLEIGPEKFKQSVLPLHGETVNLYSAHMPGSTEIISSTIPNFWFGWAPVKLPVGSWVYRVDYYHGGGASNVPTQCLFARVKFGAAPEIIGQNMATSAEPGVVPLSIMDATKRSIIADYRYFIRVSVGTGSSIRGIKIYY